MRFINTSGFPTYHIRKVRISSYLNSLYEMARFLTQSGLYPDAAKHVREEIANQIHSHIENLKATGKYDELVSQVLEFKLSTQIFDVFGKSVDNYQIHDLFTTTDTDIDRQLRLAFRASRPCQSRMSLFLPTFSEKGKTGRIPDESFQKNVQKRTKGR